MSQVKEVIVQGLWKNNSALVQLLGMCPLLAVTSTATNALGLGLATTLVLTLTNLSISALRRWTPSEIRIPVYIVIIATLVKIIQMLIKAYAPSLDSALGVFIPLIVVNCIILGRAEAFASKNGVFDSALDGLGMGLGYTVSIILMSAIRQIIATGILSFDNPFDAAQNIFSIRIIPEDFAISMFSRPFGAFCTFACLAAGLAAYKSHQQNKAKKLEKEAK